MIEFFKKYGKDVTMVGALTLMVICYYQRQDLARLRSEIKSYQNTNIDSLQTELFINQSNVGRYETALGLLSEEDSVAAKKFEDKLSETEQHIFISAMIKLTKNNGKEYIVINTEMQAGDSTAPVIIQISLKDVSEDDKFKMYQTASLLLNRIIKRSTPKPVVEKAWYKFWQWQNSYVNLGYDS